MYNHINCKQKNDFQNIDKLREILQLNSEEVDILHTVNQQYPIKVNNYYLSLIDLHNPLDPIRKMCVPGFEELLPNGNEDTSGELENTVLSGVQHKYHQTALILSSKECFVYCRHCFRKRIVGLDSAESLISLDEMQKYIKNNPTINNVLVSGGDAFYNTNADIKKYLEALVELEQLDFIRFGTRVPVVFPHRINGDNELLNMLKEYNRKKQIYVITQFNHPTEITSEAKLAIKNLQLTGIIVKNQTVLLKGVNDSSQIISSLLTKLTTCGVVPYYIFQCRPVRGVINHFQVPLRKGIEIVEQAKNNQNGQGKCMRYVLSHPTGKIEIIGNLSDGNMLFKYHQAKKDEDLNRIFIKNIALDQCWI